MSKRRSTLRQRHTSALFLYAVMFLSVTKVIHAQSSVLGPNLIVNGNAESGSAGTGSNVVSSIPGWTRSAGNVNVIPYDLSGYLQLTNPAPPDHGFQYFVGGPGNTLLVSTLTQSIDVSAAASAINSNSVKYAASAYLGAIGPSRTGQMDVTFQNASGQTIQDITLQSKSGDVGLFMQEQIGLVPTGTARVTVTLTFNGTFAAVDSASLVFTMLGTNPASVLNAELVVNGGAEAGPSAPPDTLTLYVPGWATDSGISVAPYGGPNWISLSDPGPTDRGVNLFCGTPGGSQPDMYQDIDVSPAASLIDAGQVTYQISAWLGGLGGSSPTLTYEFFDWTGRQLAPTGQLGPKSPPGSGGLINVSNSETLPPGTRRVHIDMSLIATILYMADNISFTLTAAPVPNFALPQLAFGGGWYTALYFTNLNSNSVTFPVTFTADNGQPLTIPGQSASSIQVNLPARGSALIEAPNSGSQVVEGYVTASLPAGVTGYGVFRQSVSGVPDQEAVSPLSPTNTTTSTLLFDDSKYITGVAVVNPSSAATTVTVTAYDNQGNTLGTTSIPLAANAKTEAALRNLIPAVAGALGSVDFSVSSGNVAVLGLRFNGAAFTSIPASSK